MEVINNAKPYSKNSAAAGGGDCTGEDDNNEVSVTCLLPTGVLIDIDCSLNATIMAIKEDLWLKAKQYPLYSILKDKTHYVFSGIGSNAKILNHFDETQRVADVCPFLCVLQLKDISTLTLSGDELSTIRGEEISTIVDNTSSPSTSPSSSSSSSLSSNSTVINTGLSTERLDDEKIYASIKYKPIELKNLKDLKFGDILMKWVPPSGQNW